MASAEVIWSCVRNRSAFLKKGLHGSQFSCEPGNLANRNTFKYSGLANPKSIDIQVSGDDLVVSKKTGISNKPKATVERHNVQCRGSLTFQEIDKQTEGYRSDLKKAARIRASAICKSLRVKKAGVSK